MKETTEMGRKNCAARLIRVSFAPLSRCALAFVSGFREGCSKEDAVSGRKMGRAERSESPYFCPFHLSAILANGDRAVVFRVIPPKFVLNRAKSWQKNNFLSGLIREIRGSRSFLVLGSELSNANTEFRGGRARQPAPRASLLPARKFRACRAVTKSRQGSTEPHPTKRGKEEIMKRTPEMGRINFGPVACSFGLVNGHSSSQTLA
jgi:hypothetical protein